MQTNAPERHSAALQRKMDGIIFAIIALTHAKSTELARTRHMSAHSVNRSGVLASQLAGGLMLCLVLFLWAASASQRVHDLTCSDASSTRHHCAITTFAAGNCEIPLLDPAFQTVLTDLLAVPSCGDEADLASPPCHLAPARAPPASGQ